jgi:hypothetical protein
MKEGGDLIIEPTMQRKDRQYSRGMALNHNVGRTIVTSYVGFIRLAYPVSNGRFSIIHLSGPRIWSLTKVN